MKKALFKLPLQSACALGAVLAISIGSGAQQGNPTSGERDQLIFNVLVYDKQGAPVMGLSERDFSASIDKQHAKIDFFSGQDTPASICLLVDTSTSMRHRDEWETAVSKLSRFVMLSNRGSQFLIITFSDTPRLVADWTSDKNILASAIAGVRHAELKGTTALSDACVLAINKAAQAQNQKKFILLIAHGEDDSSKTPRNQFRRLLEDSTVSVSCIAITDPRTDAYAGQGRTFLEEITSHTGGVVFFPGKPKEAADLVELSALLMRHGYQIGFNRASLPKDGKQHKFAVKVSALNGNTGETERYSVRARDGFRLSN
jgi:VWFA-related protein